MRADGPVATILVALCIAVALTAMIMVGLSAWLLLGVGVVAAALYASFLSRRV